MWRVAVAGRKIALTPGMEPEMGRRWHATPIRQINNLSTNGRLQGWPKTIGR